MKFNALWLLLLVSPSALAASPETLRVLVFPHILKYATPQGRETRVTQVAIKTAGTCTATPITGGSTRAGSRLEFKHETTPDPLFIECTAPATVERESGIPSYTYAGTFIVERSRQANLPPHLQVINIVDMETYLEGVVPTEMPASWHAEALKAQAVAARTYALWELARSRNERTIESPSYDFDDTVQYQAYLGVFSPALPSTERAVRETKDQVLLGADTLPIKAYFHADSGGHTEDSLNMFPNSPSLTCIGKPEIYDAAQAPQPWVSRLTIAQATAALQAAGAFPAGVTLQTLEAGSRFESGRVRELKATLSNGASPVWTGEAVRFGLKLKSSLFTLKREGSTLVFEGRGWGHGVGMSQWGAKLLADQRGYDYRQILEFYYTGARISQ